MFADVFSAMGGLVADMSGKAKAEHEEFLRQYRLIVETVPVEVAGAFGKMDDVHVRFKSGRKSDGYGIVLSVEDYLFWKKEISRGTRFVKGAPAVQQDMLLHLAKKIEGAGSLEPKERKRLLAMFD